MKKLPTSLAFALLLTLAGTPLRAGERELKTVESAAEAVHALAVIPLEGIPRSLLHDAAGVAVMPHVVTAGFVVDGRFGRGVLLVHQADGAWSNPVFITLEGGGIGGQAGVESTDLVLVFRTRHSLDRVLRGKGKLTLGGDLGVAAGPLGRQAEAATDARLKAEIWSYSRSRGLFAGVSVEGSALLVDHRANEVFYGFPGGHPDDVLAPWKGAKIAAVESLKQQLTYLGSPPPVVVVPAVPPQPVIVMPAEAPPHRRHY